jgi:hypothetical protein
MSMETTVFWDATARSRVENNTPKMVAGGSSDTMVPLYQNTRRHIPENSTFSPVPIREIIAYKILTLHQ